MNASSRPSQIPSSHLELWGGVECSVTRLEERVDDQQARSGHRQRPEDLERFASLGLQALRFPILWEHHLSEDAWVTTDRLMEKMRELGLRPIVGLVHHGAGPLSGGLGEAAFVTGLAAFAAEVATRYPWVDAYTPINEPLTTARFSGMYGLWHPYGRTTACFAKLFLNECLATRAAMQAIRRINPSAQFVQTEDIGHTYSTRKLAYQAELENERRFLTFDILSGRLLPASTGWQYLRRHGVERRLLESFLNDPCPPDIYGVNYYVTSERLLDHRLDRYPPDCHGGNERELYADVTAVRARAEGILGHKGILREVWERYRSPLALTEVQLACTREEQVRWMTEAWEACHELRGEGVDIRAWTAWALLGSYDWDSLLVESNGHYENGAFDVRSETPRKTACAEAIRAFANGGRPRTPVLDTPGWWRRDIRFEYEPVSTAGPRTSVPPSGRRTPPLLIIGAQGTLSRAFQHLLELRGIPFVAIGRAELDICDGAAVTEAIRRLSPWAVVNTAGYVRVDDAELEREACFAVNVRGASHLGAACAEFGIPLVVYSSDLVFGDGNGRPRLESHLPDPLNVYGRSKYEMERRVSRLYPDALIIRTSAFFGPWDEANFVFGALRQLWEGGEVVAADDQVVSPTYVPDLVNTSLDLLLDGEKGIWHLANAGEATWVELARHAAELSGQPVDRIRGVTTAELGLTARRPRNSALASERAALLRPWQDALERYFTERSNSVFRNDG